MFDKAKYDQVQKRRNAESVKDYYPTDMNTLSASDKSANYFEERTEWITDAANYWTVQNSEIQPVLDQQTRLMAARQLAVTPICEERLIRPAEKRKLDSEMCTLIQQVEALYVMPDYCVARGFTTRSQSDVDAENAANKAALEAAEAAIASN